MIFVSHQMAAIEKFCDRGIVLHQGCVQHVGDQVSSITRYLTSFSDSICSLNERTDRQGSGSVKVTAIEIKDERGNNIDVAISGQTIDIHLHFQVFGDLPHSRVIANIAVSTQMDSPVFLQHNRLTGDEFGVLPREGTFVCRIRELPLPGHTYQIMYALMEDGIYLDALSRAISLTVINGNFYGSGEVPPISHGVCLVNAQWHVEPSQVMMLCNS